ncbi:MAG: family 20 glycosylhydrolase [Verrucomicrobiae bacterium]|nr:family 20 glycosylhydrolase [Verrucomicrobiae bacterium]
MSDLLDRALPLLPHPQRLHLGPRKWAPRRNWRFSEGPLHWSFGAGKNASSLFNGLTPPENASPEAYALVAGPDGVAAVARHPLGLLRARATLRQLLALAGDAAIPETRIADWPDLPVRGVHLDLKYIMHRKDYLMRWLDTLAEYKINTLLLEYEDKFPYRCHPVLRHPLAFTEAELKAFLAKARGHGIRVVPLLQNLGHVEYILKHEEFAHLRRNGWHTEYDTTKPEVLSLIREILDDVLRFHGEDEWVHAGGDECFSLLREPREIAAKLYGRHMAKVLEHLVARGKRPLIWQDMIAGLPPALREALLRRIPRNTLLCHWQYSSIPKAATRGDALSKDAPAIQGAFDMERWREFRRAGFDTLGVSCKNWGSLVPMYSRCVGENIVEMIRAAHRYDALGTIMSSWACFNMPLPMEDLGMALGADRGWRIRRETERRGIEDAWARLRFGLPDARAVEAIHLLGGQIELPTKETRLGRPIHLPYWGYMDLVLHYPNAHEDRIKYGAAGFPPGIAWRRIAERRIALYAAAPERATAAEALRRFARQARAAREMLPPLRRKARRGRAELEWLEWAAKFRRHAAERFLLLAEGGTPAARRKALAESRRLRAGLRKNYRWFLEPSQTALQAASLFEGEEALLQAGTVPAKSTGRRIERTARGASLTARGAAPQLPGPAARGPP